MKRKIAIMLCVICCLGLVACGEKEEQSSNMSEKETTVIQDKAVEGNVAEDNVEATEEKENDNISPETEVSDEIIEEAMEEVIGDVDVAADELSMADMTEQVIGLDIPMIANEGTDKETFKDFTVIFPSPMFITGYSENGARADLEAIDFVLTAVLTISEPSNNIRENMGETQEYIGENYVLEKRAGRNSKYGYQMSYDIINTTNNNRLMITLTINKEAEYQEYGDKLADEFSVAFEEAVRKNLE